LADGKSKIKRELEESIALAGSTTAREQTESRKSGTWRGMSALGSSMGSLSLSPSTDTTSWLSSITKKIYQHDNSGPLIFFVMVVLLVLAGAAVCLWQHPAVKNRRSGGCVPSAADDGFLVMNERSAIGARQPSNYVRSQSSQHQSPFMSTRSPIPMSSHALSGRAPVTSQQVAGPPCRTLTDDAPNPDDLDDDVGLGSRMNSTDSQFCPDLIVPQHNECILCMPLNSDWANSSFEITDADGKEVLRVVTEPATAGRLWRATVTTTSGAVLAQCCEARSQASSSYSPPEFQLMRAGGQIWATLKPYPSNDRYSLTLLAGPSLQIFGNFDNHAINITDDRNRLYANTEIGPVAFDHGRQYCKVRVAPLADVGLALCGFLCVRHHARRLQR
jgi:hypothetical protein